MHDSLYSNLSAFCRIAQFSSFTSAAEELNLTKGAISYQVRQLETELGFKLFERTRNGVNLTARGQDLLQHARTNLASMDREIARLRGDASTHITLGLSTYFASRWLSSRLMIFMSAHPEISLRLQPLVDLHNLERHGIDIAIRWGNGRWTDLEITPLFTCPAFPTANAETARAIGRNGLEAASPRPTLLHDRDGSTAWQDWHESAGITYEARRDPLIIPDPNVRVQSVIDGQGIALNDALVEREIASGELHRVSSIELEDYGYFLACPARSLRDPAISDFRDWITAEATAD